MSNFAALDDKQLPAHQLAASLIDLACARGVDRNRLLRGTGIFYEDIRSGKHRLSASQLLRLMANARQLMPGKDAAFLLGRRLFPGAHTASANLLMHCRDLGDALKLLGLVKMQLCPFIYGQLHIYNQRCYLLLDDAFGCAGEFQFVLEAYCTALVAASRQLFAQRVPFHFDFPFPRPRHIQEYEENLGIRLRFNQPLLCISFEQKYLRQPCIQFSQTLKWHALRQLRAQRTMLNMGFLEAAKRQLQQHRNMALSELAEVFNISPATLKRRLKQHGVSFSQLQDEVNRQQALFLLHVKGLNNEAIAAEMAFNDIPNFRRAFKRWTGSTPSQARLGWKLIDFSG